VVDRKVLQVLDCTRVAVAVAVAAAAAAAVDNIVDRGTACSWRAIGYFYLHSQKYFNYHFRFT